MCDKLYSRKPDAVYFFYDPKELKEVVEDYFLQKYGAHVEVDFFLDDSKIGMSMLFKDEHVERETRLKVGRAGYDSTAEFNNFEKITNEMYGHDVQYWHDPEENEHGFNFTFAVDYDHWQSMQSKGGEHK